MRRDLSAFPLTAQAALQGVTAIFGIEHVRGELELRARMQQLRCPGCCERELLSIERDFLDEFLFLRLRPQGRRYERRGETEPVQVASRLRRAYPEGRPCDKSVKDLCREFGSGQSTMERALWALHQEYPLTW